MFPRKLQHLADSKFQRPPALDFPIAPPMKYFHCIGGRIGADHTNEEILGLFIRIIHGQVPVQNRMGVSLKFFCQQIESGVGVSRHTSICDDQADFAIGIRLRNHVNSRLVFECHDSILVVGFCFRYGTLPRIISETFVAANSLKNQAAGFKRDFPFGS